MKDRLKKLRKNAHKTQAQVAQLLHITQPAYAKYEKGITEPDCSSLRKLSTYYGVDIDYIVKDKSSKITELEADILQRLKKLSLDNQKIVLNIVKELARVKTPCDIQTSNHTSTETIKEKDDE